ncbi:MAG: LysR family transcriptional regulator [Clostridia bacterium]|nr:LysR family transcriptional regulator [Lachnospiraceae bacterium]MBQ8300118.1 LysR family transcriptional regulator [Clostridia bacterium]
MEVNFEYYKIFYYVAKYGNITKAAGVLKSNQPNVTRIIKLLEMQLNCQLFIREPRGLRLTEDGEKLYSHVEIACQHLLNAEAELNCRETECKGTVEIGVTETALHLFLLQTLRDFKAKYPEVKIKIQNNTTPEILKALISGKLDLAIVTTPFSLPSNLCSQKMLEFQEILVCSKNYTNISDHKIKLEELCNHSFIGLGNGTATYEFYQKHFIEHHLDYKLDMEVATSDLMLPLILNDLGIGFVAESTAMPLLQTNRLMKINLDIDIPKREIQMVWDKGRGKSQAADTFQKYLESR